MTKDNDFSAQNDFVEIDDGVCRRGAAKVVDVIAYQEARIKELERQVETLSREHIRTDNSMVISKMENTIAKQREVIEGLCEHIVALENYAGEFPLCQVPEYLNYCTSGTLTALAQAGEGNDGQA